jgi:hypothetical protein
MSAPLSPLPPRLVPAVGLEGDEEDLRTPCRCGRERGCAETLHVGRARLGIDQEGSTTVLDLTGRLCLGCGLPVQCKSCRRLKY